MRFSLLSITATFMLGLVAADSAPNSFDSWKQTIPSCAQPCFDDFYSSSVGSSCASDAASSTKLSDLQCVCNAMEANLQTGGDTALQCSSSKCGSGSNTAALQGLAREFLEFLKFPKFLEFFELRLRPKLKPNGSLNGNIYRVLVDDDGNNPCIPIDNQNLGIHK
ncbi:uncharacterized protein N7458_006693 [Penicillium daleae]|uniref:Extracellular membrane protein CFEM domain-containing protein n=1 Tax=Penicillium daleae TaxID=63821 RepID=A0AAD6C574_9EURO|nr:uncharacterized protein N7458_006693 [Penicillium daleae]KAJ5450244.1 hypothetical protein N7458_006693 [Penicillium daleae]